MATDPDKVRQFHIKVAGNDFPCPKVQLCQDIACWANDKCVNCEHGKEKDEDSTD